MLSFSRARGVVRGNVALVGDSSCTVDSISGQGLSLAFQQAGQLAEALAAGNLRAIRSCAQPSHHRPAVRMTRLLLLMNSSVALRRKVLRLFAARPSLFAKMISVHTGDTAPDALKASAIVKSGLARAMGLTDESSP